jgi:serine/threonine protein phosphatase PrpC
MVERFSGVKASIGFFSATGARERNEDFAGAVFGWELPSSRSDIVAAIADGIGSTKGGRVAAETAVRGFLDGFCELPETMEVRRAAAKVINSLNSWIHSLGQRDPDLAEMGCTFTALVLRGHIVHVLHIGDTRAYRFSSDRLTLLTTDHAREIGPGRSGVLYRALGVETEARLDYTAQPVARHDRFLLCSDGVHGVLLPERIADIMREQSGSTETARALVAAALQSSSDDNCTAMVIDVVELPTGGADVGAAMMQLPLIPVPTIGETVDGFLLKALISDGRYTRLFLAVDELEGGEFVLKFPKLQVGEVAAYRAAFVRETWVGARVNSPWIGRIIELPPGRQTSLYTIMPFYQGELLEARIARRPLVALEEGRNIAIKLARAIAALHRADIIHRDIKPDNVILQRDGSLKLIDLGVVRVPGLEDAPPQNIPGTVAYMAPEMFEGEAGNEATDLYALGVTMYRAFTAEFPYGNVDATSRPRRQRPIPLATLRPDLPAWLEATLARAIALNPAERFRDVAEFALEMEAVPARSPVAARRPRTFYERSPVRFWQGVAALLALVVILLLWLRH